jgi:hypothetical protein
LPEDPGSSVSEPTTLDQAASPSISSFGRYRLIQRLGSGGMGEVWLAEQTEPVRREVALKVIKAGMDSAQVVARFEAERQALALMDHPAIARVFDGGTTPEGRPYFAMELCGGNRSRRAATGTDCRPTSGSTAASCERPPSPRSSASSERRSRGVPAPASPSSARGRAKPRGTGARRPAA